MSELSRNQAAIKEVIDRHLTPTGASETALAGMSYLMAAAPASVAGLMVAISEVDPQAFATAFADAHEKWSYHPQTKSGKYITHAVGQAFSLLGKVGDFLGDAVMDPDTAGHDIGQEIGSEPNRTPTQPTKADAVAAALFKAAPELLGLLPGTKQLREPGLRETAAPAAGPVLVYHGTQLKPGTALKTTTQGQFGPGIYATTSKQEAGKYSTATSSVGDTPNVVPLQMSLKNPLVLKADVASGEPRNWFKKDGFNHPSDPTNANIVDALKAKGHDGIIATQPEVLGANADGSLRLGDETTHHVAFSPESVVPAGRTTPAVAARPSGFAGKLRGVHGSQQPLGDILHPDVFDAGRYDDGGLVWGNGFYSAEPGDYGWFRGGDIRMWDYNHATNVDTSFKNAAVVSPNTLEAFLAKVKRGKDDKGVIESFVPKKLQELGHDGVIVRGFNGQGLTSMLEAAAKKGLIPERDISDWQSALMDQVVHFSPEGNVKVVGPDARMHPLLAERAKLKAELEKVAAGLETDWTETWNGLRYSAKQLKTGEYYKPEDIKRGERAKAVIAEHADTEARIAELNKQISDIANERPAQNKTPPAASQPKIANAPEAPPNVPQQILFDSDGQDNRKSSPFLLRDAISPPAPQAPL